jgi:hypothetical protein
LQFDEQGEKTGWTYIRIPGKFASKLNPENKKTFRAKGKLDEHEIRGMALLPMGNGDYIMALNADLRRKLRKGKGASLRVQLAFDEKPLAISTELLDCLKDEPRALSYFQSLNKSHQGYFSKWIESAKTDPTRAKRIALAVDALAKGFGFPEMLHAQQAKKP